MEAFEDIKKYVDMVCEQIRWQKARPFVAKEIKEHILDQRDAYVLDGDSIPTATKKALLQMGDAVTLGTELDKIHRPQPQWIMIFLTGLLMLLGSLTNLFIPETTIPFGVVSHILAFVIFLLAYFSDFTLLRNYALLFYFIFLICSVLTISFSTFVDGVAYFSLGNHGFSLAYLSFLFPLAFSMLIYALRNKGNRGICLCGIGGLPFFFLSYYISSFSGFLLVSISYSTLLIYSTTKGWFQGSKIKNFLTLFFIISLPILFSFIYNHVFSTERLDTFSPMIHDLLRGSSLIGKGSYSQTLEYTITLIPLSTHDYTLVFFIYRFGFLPFIALLLLFLTFSVIGLYYMTKQKSVLGSLISLSILLTFMLQSAFYTLDNLLCYTKTTLSLPFISYSKVALIINALLIGFLLSVFRTGDVFFDTTKNTDMMLVD